MTEASRAIWRPIRGSWAVCCATRGSPDVDAIREREREAVAPYAAPDGYDHPGLSLVASGAR